nr:hypothetical protein [Tanacetum cinerariifolium]
MDDPNITMEEYIQLMADKARRHAIVYNDASTSNETVSSKPTVSIYNAIKSDIDFSISFFDSEDEDYTFIYNKDLTSYKLVHVNDSKTRTATSVVDVAATWASRTQSDDVTLLHGLTYDPQADMACHVVVTRGHLVIGYVVLFIGTGP